VGNAGKQPSYVANSPSRVEVDEDDGAPHAIYVAEGAIVYQLPKRPLDYLSPLRNIMSSGFGRETIGSKHFSAKTRNDHVEENNPSHYRRCEPPGINIL
jgi:hypothetical protein